MPVDLTKLYIHVFIKDHDKSTSIKENSLFPDKGRSVV